MRHDHWPELVPLFQSAINNAPSPQRKGVRQITAFTGRPASNPVSVFLRSYDCQPVSLTQAQLESTLNVSELTKLTDDLHSLVHEHTQKVRERMRQTRSQGQLANFTEGYYVLVARDDFFETEKLCLPS